ncbi:hypothetical protein J5N97_022953 [Dioscorea zingiberensis]|uniref:Thylakoid lumenal 17.4 kDa protein, chloroplastic n=1 Tax=Dioscorea zingiberensis TaxID=325984 RepID=A0A9D5CBI5_9LILI|nr:hypothetical protein J5N97_022953 [Dioscorea zingiberensis]
MTSVCIPVAGAGHRLPSLRRHHHPKPSYGQPTRFRCYVDEEGTSARECVSSFKGMKSVACGLLAAWAVTAASPVVAANQRLPPLSTDPNRCERAFVGNTIGQANGVYDKPIDLRFCDYTNDKSNLKGKSLAAALMSEAKFDGADMSEVVMSKAYAVGASFKGVDFSNAVLDRVNFGNADLQGVIFKNTVLSGSTFNDAKLEGAVFEDTIIGYIDLQKLCTNTSINAEGRAELGCR